MPGRLGTIVDEASGKMREGAVTKVDDNTVKIVADEAATSRSSRASATIRRWSCTARSTRRARDFVKNPIGTGAFELVSYDVGPKVVYKRRENGKWWKRRGLSRRRRVHRLRHRSVGDGLGAFEAGEVHTNHETSADYVTILEGVGAVTSEVVTAATIVARTNVTNKPYDDQRVRNALQLAVDNAVVLQLGYGNAGEPAENHHVAPIHPEYVALPKIARDPAKAKALMAEAGQADFEHDIDHGRRGLAQEHRRRHRRPAARRRHQGQAHGSAGLDLLERLDQVSLLADQLEHAPAGRPGGRHRLPHRRGLERSGLLNPELDAAIGEALSIADAEKRKVVDGEDREDPPGFRASSSSPTGASSTTSSMPAVKNHGMHPTFEHDFGRVWLDERLDQRLAMEGADCPSSVCIRDDDGHLTPTRTAGGEHACFHSAPSRHHGPDHAVPDDGRLLHGQSRAEPAEAGDQPARHALAGRAASKAGWSRTATGRTSSCATASGSASCRSSRTSILRPARRCRASASATSRPSRISAAYCKVISAARPSSRRRSSSKLFPALAATGKLMFWVMVTMVPISLLIGILAGMREGTRTDRTLSVASIATTATPEYVSGVIFTVIFASWLGWLNGSAASRDRAGASPSTISRCR